MKNFDNIHKLLKAGLFQEVICLLIEDDNISKDYNFDLNHAWYLVGLALYNLDDFATALVAFKKALFFDSKDYDAMFAIGNCYCDLELAYRAFFFFRRVFDKDENYDALYNLGNCYFDLGEYDNAVLAYSEIPFQERSYDLAQKNLLIAKEELLLARTTDTNIYS